MSAAGFMSEMVRKMNQNRELLKKRINQDERIHSVKVHYSDYSNGQKDQLSAADKQKVLTKIEEEYRTEKRRYLILKLIILPLLVGILITLIWFIL